MQPLSAPATTERPRRWGTPPNSRQARGIAQVRRAAATNALAALRRTGEFLDQRLVPHERAEEAQLYPAVAAALGGAETTATMSRMHAEIDRLSARIRSHLNLAETHQRIGEDQVGDLLATLYGLHTVLRLHFTQEEESYFALAETGRGPRSPRAPHHTR